MNEWQEPIRNIKLTSLDMLELWRIDTFHPWDQLEVSKDTLDIAPNFINYKQRNGEVIQELDPLCPSINTSPTNQ